MGQKERIVALLQNGAMTHAELAQSVCGDSKKYSVIHAALQGLVKSGVVARSGARPAIYSLAGAAVAEEHPAVHTRQKTKKKELRDVSGDVISNDTLNAAAAAVAADPDYGPENDLLARCLRRFPHNTDADIVAMKIGLIDITNSTHLSQHKSKINMAELSRIIASIPEIDRRIAEGDPSVVDEIARANGQITLLSFASKYCCYHNRFVYGRDDYSIIDTVLKDYLPLYFRDGITTFRLNTFAYGEYMEYIDRNLDRLGITTENRRKKWDNFVWYKNR